MRKAFAVTLVVFVGVLLLAAPALAFKDPFKPVVDPDATASPGTSTGTTGDPATTSNGNPFSEDMPNTGADTASWMVLSYVLVVFGAAALALAWTRRPTPTRRQVFRS